MRFRFQFDDRTSYIKVNTRGTLYILLTIAVGFAATNTMNNLLYLVLSVLLAVMGLSGVYARRNLRNIVFSIHIPEEIFKNRTSFFTVSVRPDGGKKYNIFVRVLNGVKGVPLIRETVEISIPLSFKKRGVHKIEEIRFFSSFPFGFFTREEIFPIDVEFIVFPRIYDVSERAFKIMEERVTGAYESEKAGIGGDFLGLREYQDGEPISMIHWKASARNDELYTKIFTGPGTGQIVLTERDLIADEYEERIDELASLADYFLKMGFSVGINFGSLKIEPDSGEIQRLKILRELALL